MSASSKDAYTAADSGSEKWEHDAFLEEFTEAQDKGWWAKDMSRSSILSRWLKILPWILTVLFAMLSLILWLLLRQSTTAQPYGTYEVGFSTDIVPTSKIPLEQIRFRGSPQFAPNSTGWVEPVDKAAKWPENMVLFGPPHPLIDDNWDQLIGDRYFSISEDEARRAWGDKRLQYVDENLGGYTAGLELFHTLHCVNALRKALYPKYYHGKHHHGSFHIEHCLDALRQTIQCYGSTTLVPTQFREGLQHNYIDSDQTHTCRSFQFLRDFTDSRRRGNSAYVERDMSLVNPRKHEIAVAWKHAKSAHRQGHHQKLQSS